MGELKRWRVGSVVPQSIVRVIEYVISKLCRAAVESFRPHGILSFSFEVFVG